MVHSYFAPWSQDKDNWWKQSICPCSAPWRMVLRPGQVRTLHIRRELQQSLCIRFAAASRGPPPPVGKADRAARRAACSRLIVVHEETEAVREVAEAEHPTAARAPPGGKPFQSVFGAGDDNAGDVGLRMTLIACLAAGEAAPLRAHLPPGRYALNNDGGLAVTLTGVLQGAYVMMV